MACLTVCLYWDMHESMYVCIYLCMCIARHAWDYAYVFVFMYVWMQTCTSVYVCIHACMSVSMHICFMHVDVYVHRQICISWIYGLIHVFCKYKILETVIKEIWKSRNSGIMYICISICMHSHVHILLGSKPSGFLSYIFEYQHIGITLFIVLN